MSRRIDIEALVASLAEVEMPDAQSVNLYDDEVRRRNLTRWLSTFDADSRTALFIGEAPGTYGARITGVPFTSPHLLTTLYDPWGAFGPDSGYEIPSCEDASQREAAATVFWKHVAGHFSDLPRPLTWNVYPFWPRQLNTGMNRTPTRAEVRFGFEWLRRMIELHPNVRVVGVGRNAEYALRFVGADFIAIRHPSHGGANEFEEGLSQVTAYLHG